MKYDNITVVAIYGDGRGLSSIPSIEKTAACFPGCRKLLITNERLPTDIPQKLCGPLDYFGYSSFCMYSLWNFIDTDYALIVQHDGWALNPDNWQDRWMEYDFIGGLTHAGLSGDSFITNFQWINSPNPIVVQNGGFSLRSKKLLKALVENGIMPKLYGVNILNNEDVQLTAMMREELERKGIKFATNDDALIFSFEHLSPVIHSDVDITKIFGHHSRFRTLLNDNKMAWHLSQNDTKSIPWELKVYDLFSDHYGYQMTHGG